MISGRRYQIKIKALWDKAVGSKSNFTVQERAANSIIIISLFIVLTFFCAISFSHVPYLLKLLAVLTVVIGLLYYLSRALHKTQLAITLYAIMTYVTLIISYYLTTGINGPIIFAFVISYAILLTITPSRLHVLWSALHLTTVGTLVGYEFFNPDFIPHFYEPRHNRFISIFILFLICLSFVFFISRYLRKNLTREQKLTGAHVQRIRVQNRRISMQNKKLEALLQERDKLFSILSHDMHAPVSSIQSYLELITESPEADHPEMKKELLNLTKSTSGMLKNILTWSKAQLQGVKINLSPVDVHDIITNILNIQRSIAYKKQISLIYNEHAGIYALADADIMDLILRNIINNAIKFTPVGGSILINAGVVHNECVIAIKDTGIGMSYEQLQSLFTSNTKTTYGTDNEKGIGLGLNLCNEFIGYLNGRIVVDSEYEKGSTFSIHLPVTAHMQGNN
jgi:two-component system sensor histidine kinase/response regulator